jgi:hypothetical protein
MKILPAKFCIQDYVDSWLVEFFFSVETKAEAAKQ